MPILDAPIKEEITRHQEGVSKTITPVMGKK